MLDRKGERVTRQPAATAWRWYSSTNEENTMEKKTTKKERLTAGVGIPTQVKQRQVKGHWFRNQVKGTAKMKRKEEKRRKKDNET